MAFVPFDRSPLKVGWVLPTTVVLDPGGRAVAVNAGYASETALRDQVRVARSSMAGAFA